MLSLIHFCDWELVFFFFFFQAEDGIRDLTVTGVQTCALPILDLGRNDVGRVARFGSVRVTDLLTIERYSHVQHLVSEVRGQLRDGYDALDVFKACFPAGTVTGAPKVRAMAIIDELEPERRGPYAGAVGYVGWGATNLDTAIAIRAAVVLKDRVVVQAGAGIVADSDPARAVAAR